jgi:hypothetical protein
LDAISDDGSVNGRRLRLRLAASQPEPVSHRATIYRSASPVWFQPTARPRRTPISLLASPVRLEAAADRTSFSLPASPLWFSMCYGPNKTVSTSYTGMVWWTSTRPSKYSLLYACQRV